MEIAYQKTSDRLRRTRMETGECDLRMDLSKFTTGNYRGGPMIKMIAWYLVNCYIFNTSIPWPYSFKRWLLRIFGAKVGSGVIIKTNVRIKYPWRLRIGNHSWVGESVWIDNLEQVDIGNNVALSQAAVLLTGNHDYTDITFPYRLDKIILEDGVWIGARAIVCPGVVCRSHSVLTVNSVASKDLDPCGIYAGQPATFVRTRKMKNA